MEDGFACHAFSACALEGYIAGAGGRINGLKHSRDQSVTTLTLRRNRNHMLHERLCMGNS